MIEQIFEEETEQKKENKKESTNIGIKTAKVLFILFGILILLNAIMMQTQSVMHQIYQQLQIITGIILLGFALIFDLIKKQ